MEQVKKKKRLKSQVPVFTASDYAKLKSLVQRGFKKAEIAHRFGFSQKVLDILVDKIYHVSFKEYADSVREEYAMGYTSSVLINIDFLNNYIALGATQSECAIALGVSDTTLNNHIVKHYGMSFNEYAERHTLPIKKKIRDLYLSKVLQGDDNRLLIDAEERIVGSMKLKERMKLRNETRIVDMKIETTKEMAMKIADKFIDDMLADVDVEVFDEFSE